MIIVLDTSAAVDLILNPSLNNTEAQILAEAKWVLAPTLYISEVSNVFWKYHNFHNLPQEKAEQGIELALKLPDSLANDSELFKEAFSMSCITKHPVYDMMYLVLARRNNAILLTKDRRLKTIAEKHDVRISR
ncbi:type II toxin-antitoxin system VapC family toxin, partial [PVC group bacterium]|nr:type II toxin-antitoxin system VapC family toxin [PVC group bacterium]